MRPIALLGLTLTLTLPLAGCGDTWWNPPFTGGYNPHVPVIDSDNMRRVMGQDAPTTALAPEPGNVWPGPLPPSPTLQDPEGQSRNGLAGAQPGYAPAPPTGTRPRSAPPAATAEVPATPAAGAGSPIVVPNGNGTSTVIHSDGRIETITTPQ